MQFVCRLHLDDACPYPQVIGRDVKRDTFLEEKMLRPARRTCCVKSPTGLPAHIGKRTINHHHHPRWSRDKQRLKSARSTGTGA